MLTIPLVLNNDLPDDSSMQYFLRQGRVRQEDQKRYFLRWKHFRNLIPSLIVFPYLRQGRSLDDPKNFFLRYLKWKGGKYYKILQTRSKSWLSNKEDTEFVFEIFKRTSPEKETSNGSAAFRIRSWPRIFQENPSEDIFCQEPTFQTISLVSLQKKSKTTCWLSIYIWSGLMRQFVLKSSNHQARTICQNDD